MGPVVLIASAEHTTAQSEYGVSARDDPAHAGMFKLCVGNALASTFYDTGADADALGPEVGVVQAAAVLDELVGALARRWAGGGVRAQSGEQEVEAALLEIVAPGCLLARPSVSLGLMGIPVPMSARSMVRAEVGTGWAGSWPTPTATSRRRASGVRSMRLVPTRTPIRSSGRPLAWSKLSRGAGRAGHARHAGRPVGAHDAQGPVAGEEAVAAGGAVVVGVLEGQRA